MKRSLLIFLFLPYISLAQTVSNVTSQQNGNIIQINYRLSDISANQTVKVNLYYSLNNSNYIGHLQKVSGDVGDFISGNGVKQIKWDVLNEIGSLEGETKFKVELIPSNIYDSPTSTSKDMKGKVKSCRITQNTVIVDFELESLVNNDWVFRVQKAFIFDDKGNNYISESFKWSGNTATEYATINLMKGIPFRIKFYFNNVDPTITKVSGISLSDNYNIFTLRFTDIPLIKDN